MITRHGRYFDYTPIYRSFLSFLFRWWWWRWDCGVREVMMTSSNGNIFRVTGHLCGNSPVTGEFPAQKLVTRSFDVFYLRLNERVSTQSWDWWFETPSRSLWRHCNVRTKVNGVQSSDVITRHSIIWRCIQHISEWSQTYITVNTHKRHFIYRPYGRTVGCLLWGFWPLYNGTALYHVYGTLNYILTGKSMICDVTQNQCLM